LAVFCGKVNPECRGTGKKGRKKPKNPGIQGLAVTPSGKGRGNGKKPLWGGHGKVAEGKDGI